MKSETIVCTNACILLQILCLAEMVSFTERCEEAIKVHNLNNFIGEMEQQLESYTNVDITSSGDVDAGVLELKLKALILDTIHNIEVVQHCMDHNIRDSQDWMWQKQLRYAPSHR